MKNLYVVIKNELIRFFASPIAYVYLITFLILNGSFTFYFGHFIERNQADLLSMFSFQPWLYLLFISGISMRLWSEEFKQKTVLQLLCMPIKTITLVWGKFFATLIFASIALFLTFPLWISVNFLGNPDNHVIALGYVGCFLIAASMIAISQTMSALSKNQVIALILSVIANLLFFLSSLEFVLSLFRLFLPETIVNLISLFSFLYHFNNMSVGLLDLNNIVYFCSIIVLFNTLTYIIVCAKTCGFNLWSKVLTKTETLFTALLLIFMFIGINLISQNHLKSYRKDFTENKLFTLSQSTQKIVSGINHPITAKLYYSPVLGQKNHLYREAFNSIVLLLDQYHNLAPEKFNYTIYNPQPFSETEDFAIAQNIQQIPLSNPQQLAFFGLSLTDTINRNQSIPLFLLSDISLFEKHITERIYLLRHTPKNLGIISDLPIFESSFGDMVTPEWKSITKLRKFYNIVHINNNNPKINNIDVLMIMHPQNLSEDLTQNIKQYSLNGGKILLLTDPSAEASRNFAPTNALIKPSNLNGLDNFWGIHFLNNAVVADIQNAITVNDKAAKNNSYTKDILQILLSDKNLNKQEPETKHLQNILLSSAGAFVQQPNSSNVYKPLIFSSQNSSLMPSSLAHNTHGLKDLLQRFKSDNSKKHIAVKVSGPQEHPFKLIAIADTDFLYDSFWSKEIGVFDKIYQIEVFDNVNFILNALDTLVQEDAFSDLRGKHLTKRSLKTIEDLENKGLLDFIQKEQAILQAIKKAQTNIEEISTKKTFEGRENFTPDELSLISKTSKKLQQLKQDLSLSKQQSVSQTNNLVLWLKFLNIYSIASVVLVYLLFKSIKMAKISTPFKISINKPILILLSVSFVVFFIGILGTHIKSRNEITKYEDDLFLPQLTKQIGSVSKIKIITKDATLNFYKNNDDKWVLQDKENFLVYNNRIKFLLKTLMTAKIYEKKSNRLEDLPEFNLEDLSNQNSNATAIILSDNNGKEIYSLLIGTHNLYLGGGIEGAFIRHQKQFQTWLIKGAFVDIKPDWQKWTYSSLWNLAFGRIAAINSQTDAQKLLPLIKLMLNSYFSDSITSLPDKEKIMQLQIKAENVASFDIIFWKHNNLYYAEYIFETEPSSKLLQQFTQTIKAKYYQINNETMEQIIEAEKNL